MNNGISTSAPTSTARPVNPGLSQISQARAPTKVRKLRSATETDEPTMFSTMVMSVVSRYSTSPVRVVRKNAWSRPMTWR